jgi:hypothetical protein
MKIMNDSSPKAFLKSEIVIILSAHEHGKVTTAMNGQQKHPPFSPGT